MKVVIPTNKLKIGDLFSWESYSSKGFSKISFIENRTENKTPYITPNFQLESGTNNVESTPIDLSEDMFLRMGFIYDDFFKIYYREDFNLCFMQSSEKEYRIGYLTEDKFVIVGNTIFYFVHQVQNVYSSLMDGKTLIDIT